MYTTKPLAIAVAAIRAWKARDLLFRPDCLGVERQRLEGRLGLLKPKLAADPFLRGRRDQRADRQLGERDRGPRVLHRA